MTDLAKRRAELIAWAQSCLDSGDRHGLRDAACDLEIVEARMEERQGRIVPVEPSQLDYTATPTGLGPAWDYCQLARAPMKCGQCGCMLPNHHWGCTNVPHPGMNQ